MLLVEQSGGAEATERIAQLPPQVFLAETQPPVPGPAEAPPVALKAGRIAVGLVAMDGPFAVWHKSQVFMREDGPVPPPVRAENTTRRALDAVTVMDGPFAIWHQSLPYEGDHYPNTKNRYYASARHGSGF